MLPFILCALAASPAIQRRVSLGGYLAAGIVLMALSMVCLDLAEVHQAFFFAAMALLTFAFSSAPAFMTAITLVVSENDQAKTQGAVSATFHGVAAIALSLYGALFKWQASLPGHVVSLPFWVGSLCSMLAVALGLWTGTWHALSEAGERAHAAEVASSDPEGSSYRWHSTPGSADPDSAEASTVTAHSKGALDEAEDSQEGSGSLRSSSSVGNEPEARAIVRHSSGACGQCGDRASAAERQPLKRDAGRSNGAGAAGSWLQ